MGMREYPDATFKVSTLILKQFDEHKNLLNYLEQYNIDFDTFAQYMRYNDMEHFKDCILDYNRDEENGEYIEEHIDSIVDEVELLFNKLKKAFESKYKGFSIELIYISYECSGDVSSSFFGLTGFVKQKTYKLAEWVTWTEWA